MAIITLKCNWYLHELGDRQKLLQYFQEIKGKSIEWELLERPVQMTIDYSFEIVQHREEVIREETLNAYIDLFPDNELARDTLQILQKHKHQDATYKATLYLTGEIGASISIQKNTIILDSQKEYQSELEEIIDKADLTEYLDDDFYMQIREQGRAFCYSIVLSDTRTWKEMRGQFQIMFDNKAFREENYFEFYYLDRLSERRNIALPSRQLDLLQCYSWIKEHTSLCQKKERSPIYFTILTYLFNRDNFESMMYAIIALENLYCEKGGKGVSYLLQQRIKSVFPSIDDVTIKKIYKIRSRFVHGEQEFSIYDSYVEFDDDDKETIELICIAELVLIETIRLLIANNASRLRFIETSSYECM